MHWDSVEAFFAMGGYGVYVWGSFGVTAIACGLELITLTMRKHRASVEHLT